MRNFQPMNQVSTAGGGITIGNEHGAQNPLLAMVKEGSYVAISVSYGPLEIALRLHLDDVQRAFRRLQHVEGLQMTRQIGTGQAYLGIGLMGDGGLVICPTIIADATGHMSLNVVLTDDARAALYQWLGV